MERISFDKAFRIGFLPALREPDTRWAKFRKLFKTPRKMRHVRKSPAVGNFTDRSMGLIWVFERVPAACKPPCANEATDRRIMLRKNAVGVSHADPDGIGHCLRVKRRISESCFDNRTNV